MSVLDLLAANLHMQEALRDELRKLSLRLIAVDECRRDVRRQLSKVSRSRRLGTSLKTRMPGQGVRHTLPGVFCDGHENDDAAYFFDASGAEPVANNDTVAKRSQVLASKLIAESDRM